jgi:signal transduction histidine kinase
MSLEPTCPGTGDVRKSDASVSRLSGSSFDSLAEVLDTIPAILCLLDRKRQIVLVNREFARVFDVQSGCAGSGVQNRFGAIVRCVRALEATHGCGMHPGCQFCGMLAAVNGSFEELDASRELCFTRRNASGCVESMEFRVIAEPFRTGDEVLTLVTLVDISNEKRRRVLERVFFHDLLNTAGNVQGLAQMLTDSGGTAGSVQEIAGLLCFAAEQLIEEINAQKIIVAAEQNYLVPHPDPTELLPEIQSVARAYAAHDVARGRVLKVAGTAESVTVITDCHLLRRVIINLVKNALEATERGGTVTLDLRLVNSQALISVHNASVMREDVRLQVFHRSFSTRGQDRGLGTYSVKLLTESYLKGTVSFVSEPGIGTVFTVAIPVEWQGNPA